MFYSIADYRYGKSWFVFAQEEIGEIGFPGNINIFSIQKTESGS
jgi:hypothetical protein